MNREQAVKTMKAIASAIANQPKQCWVVRVFSHNFDERSFVHEISLGLQFTDDKPLSQLDPNLTADVLPDVSIPLREVLTNDFSKRIDEHLAKLTVAVELIGKDYGINLLNDLEDFVEDKDDLATFEVILKIVIQEKHSFVLRYVWLQNLLSDDLIQRIWDDPDQF